MPDLRREIWIVTRPLPEGLWLAEILHLPEVSRTGVLRRQVHRELLRELRRLAGKMHPGGLYRLHGGPAGDMHPVHVEVEWAGERELASRAVALSFPALVFRWQDDLHAAYVPALGIHHAATTPRKLERGLELEIRRALQRTRADRDLLRLAVLARHSELELEPRHTRVSVPTLLEHRRERENTLRRRLGGKPVLPQVATLLRPRRLREAYEVDAPVERLARELSGDSPSPVLLVGPPGVGKSSIAYEMVRRAALLGLDGREFWETSGSRLAAGASGFGMIQERCQALAREVRERKAILLLGNLFELVQVGRATEASEGVAAVLQPLLARGRLLGIAECTPAQAEQLERKDPRLVAAFRRVPIAEPDEAAVRRILARCAEVAVRRRRAVIDPAALDAVFRLHRRFAGYSAFPGKAVLFLQSLLTEGGLDALVGEEEVVAAFAEQSGLPRFLLDDTVPLDVAETRAWFRARILGQPEAVGAIVDLTVAVKAGLGRAERPLASLFFVGPTGVGKTESAKALAEFFFRDRARLTRFDMSEYADPWAVRRLVGAGAAEGLLVAKVREQPFQVLLLDEIEKADPGLFDLLLQVLGEGRLTDAAGRTADFRNAVIVLTSNLGAETFRAGTMGFRAEDASGGRARDHFEEEVRRFFRPELYNRIDRIVPFLPLDGATLRDLARREFDLVRRRSGVLDRNLRLEAPPEVLERIVAQGTDAAYGARPLKRALTRALIVPLAHRLNDYSWDQSLETRVTRSGDGVAVAVRGARPEAPQAPPSSAADLERLSDVRRRLHRFLDHALCVRLEDEIPHLEQVRERLRVRRRSRRVSEEELARVQMLGRMLEAREKLRRLERDVEGEEETALLGGLGLGPGPEAEALAAQADTRRTQLRDAVLTVLGLESTEPDRVCLSFHGDRETGIPRLVPAFAAAALELGATEVRAWIERKPAYGPSKSEPVPLKAVSRVAEDKTVVLVALEVVGPHAPLLFETEQGIHGIKDRRCAGQVQVRIGAWTPPGSVPRAASPLPDAPDAHSAATTGKGLRREYDFETHRARDRDHGEMLFARTGVGELIAEAIRRSIDRRIDELTLP